jgi:hypothetical protein
MWLSLSKPQLIKIEILLNMGTSSAPGVSAWIAQEVYCRRFCAFIKKKGHKKKGYSSITRAPASDTA